MKNTLKPDERDPRLVTSDFIIWNAVSAVEYAHKHPEGGKKLAGLASAFLHVETELSKIAIDECAEECSGPRMREVK